MNREDSTHRQRADKLLGNMPIWDRHRVIDAMLAYGEEREAAAYMAANKTAYARGHAHGAREALESLRLWVDGRMSELHRKRAETIARFERTDDDLHLDQVIVNGGKLRGYGEVLHYIDTRLSALRRHAAEVPKDPRNMPTFKEALETTHERYGEMLARLADTPDEHYRAGQRAAYAKAAEMARYELLGNFAKKLDALASAPPQATPIEDRLAKDGPALRPSQARQDDVFDAVAAEWHDIPYKQKILAALLRERFGPVVEALETIRAGNSSWQTHVDAARYALARLAGQPAGEGKK